MKSLRAILIGLALIAAAPFYRAPSVSPAQAGVTGDVNGLHCVGLGQGMWTEQLNAINRTINLTFALLLVLSVVFVLSL